MLESGPQEIPVVDAVVDIETAGKGSSVRYGGRVFVVGNKAAEDAVTGCF